VTLEFVAPELHGVPECRLIYARPTKNVGQLELYLDGELFHQAVLHAARGEIDLPPLATPYNSPRTIRVVTDQSTQIYARHVRVADAPTYIKRTAVRFDGSVKEFIVEKRSHETEVVRMHVYRTPSEQRCRIAAEVSRVDELDASNTSSISSTAIENSTIAPRSDWTIRNRVFDIAPTNAHDVLVLGTTNELAASQVTCFIPLGQDLPPGTYRIRVSGDAQSRGYLVLYRIQPGRSPQRRISRQLATQPQHTSGLSAEPLMLHSLSQ
jgi:hypothetical protein